MKDNLNGICNIIMIASLLLIILLLGEIIIVICWEMIFKFVDVLCEMNTMHWWILLSLLGTFLLFALISVIITPKSNLNGKK
jgi:hypothetical protein